MKKIIDCSKEIMKLRGNSMLVLVLNNINIRAAFDVYKILKEESFENLDVVLQTYGGVPSSAFQIIKTIRRHANTVNILVPWIAKSAGTIICLGADKLLMSEISELGPLDSQLTEQGEEDKATNSALNGFNALDQIQQHTIETLSVALKFITEKSNMKKSKAISLASEFAAKTSEPLYNQLDPKQIGICARALDLAEKYGIAVLTRYMGWGHKEANSVVKTLVWEYPDHDYLIDLYELEQLGLPAENIADNIIPIADELRLHIVDAVIEGKSVIELIKVDDVKPAKSSNKTTEKGK